MRKYLTILLASLLLVGCSPWNNNGNITDQNGKTLSNPQPIPVSLSGGNATITGSVNATVVMPIPLPITGTVNSTVTNVVTVNSSASNPVHVVTGNSTDHVDIQQDAVADPRNSSTTNLASGANFTGNATSTLGVNSIQVTLKTDQNMTVYIEQSPDGTNWDISDRKDYLYSTGGAGWTITALNSYYRVVVINTNGTTTTYFRLQSVLCPVADPLPHTTSSTDKLMTEATIVDDYGFDAENTPDSELRISQSVKIAGGIFTGTTVDPNFWTTNTSANGSAFQDIRTATSGGELTLATNTTANGAARVSSQRRGRYVAGNSNFVRYVVHFPDTGTANNERRWGIADYSTITSITDGAYFQLNGTTFSVVTMRGGAANVTSSGSFNGNWGTVYHLDTNNVHVYEVYYTTYAVYFSIDGRLLHKVTSDPMPWSNTPTMYIYMDNVNSGGSTSNVIMHVRSASIHRLGPTLSSPKYTHINSATTTVLKYSAGTLQSITVNAPTNSNIDVYDNIVGSGTLIAHINLGANTIPFTLTYGLDFSTGLTIVSSGTADFSVQYE